jgi:hypothetical protein
MKHEPARTPNSDYIRYGATRLCAALDTATGKVMGAGLSGHYSVGEAGEPHLRDDQQRNRRNKTPAGSGNSDRNSQPHDDWVGQLLLRMRLRQWLCAKHKVSWPATNRFPQPTFHDELGVSPSYSADPQFSVSDLVNLSPAAGCVNTPVRFDERV